VTDGRWEAELIDFDKMSKELMKAILRSILCLIISVLAAGLLTFSSAASKYSPILFGEVWVAATGVDVAAVPGPDQARIFLSTIGSFTTIALGL